ncbi:hypothetical protein M422DRAFT_235064, partial [Sphaerobolus stellatus SS14]
MNPSQSTPTIRLPMLGHQLNSGLQQQHPGLNANHLQQQQQQQQPNHNQQGPIQPPPPQSGQDFTLSSVLHFLQTEWRRYERDRNEWEIERAEMRARIALLEGERRSFENIRLDLARRIKMLEYALRMERSKQLNASSQPTGSSSKSNIPSQKDDTPSLGKEGSGSSSPRSDDSPLPDHRISMASLSGLPNGISQGPNKSQPWNTNGTFSNQALLAGVGKPPLGRDPKSRQRSKEYLKQCLQEITYLTSTQALNPLPNRPLLSNSSLPVTIPNLPPFEQGPYNGRPRKVVPESGNPNMSAPPVLGPKHPSEAVPSLNGMSVSAAPNSNNSGTASLASGSDRSDIPFHHASSSSEDQSIQQIELPQSNLDEQVEASASSEQIRQSAIEPVTAIFRPDETWREQLQNARLKGGEGDTHEVGQITSTMGISTPWDVTPRDEDDDMKDNEEEDDDVEEVNIIGEGGETAKVWRAKKTLRNHLDAVRTITFHGQDLLLASGGDDYTVKLWRVDASGLTSNTSNAKTEIEPQLTLRGHSAPVTCLAFSSGRNLLYSGSLDATIHVWRLPPSNHSTYAAFDSSLSKGTLIGHTDAVWDLTLVRDESLLVSCGADGSVKIWDVGSSTAPGSLKMTWGYEGLGEGNQESATDGEPIAATAVEAIKTDLKKIAVAYRNSVVKIFDVDTGKELGRLQSGVVYDGTPSSQINKLASHPTMPLLVTGHEDKHIRLFDITTGQCTHSMVAHLDAVTALAIDPAGFSLVSGGHDCSLRFWDLLSSRACVQETTSHREKADEGVLDVAFHPSLPFLASAGADGVIKLYATS